MQCDESLGPGDDIEAVRYAAVEDRVLAARAHLPLQLETRLHHLNGVGEEGSEHGRCSAHAQVRYVSSDPVAVPLRHR